MRKLTRRSILAGGSLLLTTFVAACGRTTPSSSTPTTQGGAFNLDQVYEAAKKEGKLVWAASTDIDLATQFIDAFKKRFPGVDVQFTGLLGEELLARARAEARGNRVTFDLIDVGSQWPDYKKLGLLGNESDVLNAAGLPPETHRGGMLVDDLNVTGAAYNSNVLKPEDLPKTWDDFLDPKWKGKFGLEERLRPFVYFTPFWGEEKVVAYLEKLKTQNPRIERGDTRNATLMLAGEIQFYIGAALGTITEMEGKPWAFMPLDEVVSVDQVGGFTIPPQAKHPNAAKLYLWWYANPKEGGVLRDKLRFRSDPRPGSGTGVSKYLEERHMKLLMAPEKWDLDQEEWTSKYAKVLGLPG